MTKTGVNFERPSGNDGYLRGFECIDDNGATYWCVHLYNDSECFSGVGNLDPVDDSRILLICKNRSMAEHFCKEWAEGKRTWLAGVEED